MATSFHVYVHSDSSPVRACAVELCRRRELDGVCALVRCHEGNPWILLSLDRESQLADLSREISMSARTEVVALASQTVVDYHRYLHYLRGEKVRELEYCSENGGWVTVSGVPQPWEDAWQARRVEHLNRSITECTDLDERAAFEEEIQWLERRKLIVGHAIPWFHCHDVGLSLGLPGFGPELRRYAARRDYWTFEEQL